MVITWDSTIREELDQVEEHMRKSVRSTQETLTEIALYVIGSGGKRIRPGVAILAYKASGGNDPSQVIKVASAFEMIHSATLIHDDINDVGEFRRGRVAAYKKYGTQKALIVGDFLFVRSFRLGGTFDDHIVGLVADACTAIAESEIIQSEHENDSKATVEDYLRIIEGKTAKPIEAGARVGAYLANKEDHGLENALGAYGLNIGMAFQMIDDILDVIGDQKSLGKPGGVDLTDGKPTLPLIFAMEDMKHGPRIKEIFLRKDKTSEEVEEGLALVRKTNAIARTKEVAVEYTKKAEKAISILPESEYKRSLVLLAETLVERNT